MEFDTNFFIENLMNFINNQELYGKSKEQVNLLSWHHLEIIWISPLVGLCDSTTSHFGYLCY